MAKGYFLIKTNSKKHVINARRWDMIDVIDLLRFRTTKLEIHLDSIFSFVFLFQVQARKGIRDQYIYAYLHILFYQGKWLRVTTLTCSCHARTPASQYFCIILHFNPWKLQLSKQFLWHHPKCEVGFYRQINYERISFLVFVVSNISSLKISGSYNVIKKCDPN